MDAANLLLSATAGAMIVVSGGLYALLLALGRLHRRALLTRAAAAAYVVLVAFVLVLAGSLELTPAWYIVCVVMLAGYGLAPKAIWHLTDATHGSDAE